MAVLLKTGMMHVVHVSKSILVCRQVILMDLTITYYVNIISCILKNVTKSVLPVPTINPIYQQLTGKLMKLKTVLDAHYSNKVSTFVQLLKSLRSAAPKALT